MATRVQLRRGTTSEHSTFTGAEGEVTVDTTKNTTVVHDGATQGGFPVATEASLASKLSPGDNVSELVNDAGYITSAEAGGVTSVNGKSGIVVLNADDIDDSTTTHKFASESELLSVASAIQPGDNISELNNDAGYITSAEVGGVTSVNGKSGIVVLNADDIDDTATTHKFASESELLSVASAIQPGDNVSELNNDAGYITSAEAGSVDSVNGQTGDVVLDADDIDDTATTHKFATEAELLSVASAIQPGDNISELNNDAGYITSAEVGGVTSINGKSGIVVLNADDIDDSTTTHKFASEAELLSVASAIQPGDNISELNNDAGYITSSAIPTTPTLQEVTNQGSTTTTGATFDGDLGVGTSTPSNKLTVLDSDLSDGTGGTVASFGTASITGGLEVITTDGNLTWGVNAVDSRNFVIQTNQTERLRVGSDGTITLDANGSGADITLSAADNVILQAGQEEDGQIKFRGTSGADSYRFAKSGQTAIEGFLSFESLTADRTFTFPDRTGTLATTAGTTFDTITFANLEKSDISADGELSFDSSQGLILYRTQQGVTGTAVTVLDGANVAAGSHMSISNLGAGSSSTGQITFSVVDGAGSGLDADKLDGVEGSSFLRSDANDSASGVLTLNGKVNFRTGADFADDDFIYMGSSDDWRVAFNANGWLYINQVANGIIFQDNGTAIMRLEDSGVFRPESNNTGSIGTSSANWAIVYTTKVVTPEIEHSGTITLDANGAGADVTLSAADNVILQAGAEENGSIYFRGVNGANSYRFAKSGQTAIEGFLSFESLTADKTFTFPNTSGTIALTSSKVDDADKLDGLSSASFLRADANDTASGTITFNGVVNIRSAIDLADNDILRFGSGDDCELFCNGSHMYMDLNSGIGNFYIRDGTTTRFTFDDSGKFYSTGAAYFNSGTQVGRGTSSAQNIAFVADSGGCYVIGNSESSNPKPLIIRNGRPGNDIKFQTAFSSSNPTMVDRMRIDKGGNVYILDQTGSGTVNAQLTSTGLLVRSSSDRDLKQNIADLPTMAEVVKSLRPRQFNWIDTTEMGSQLEYGFIAQEVQQVIADAVSTHTAGDDKPQRLGLNYQTLTAALTKALQEALTRIETLENQVSQLQGN